MLQLVQHLGKIGLVSWTTPEKDFPELLDYNPRLKRIALERNAYIAIPEGYTEDKVKTLLKSKPNACIHNLVSHNPIPFDGEGLHQLDYLVETQRIVIDDKPYIDLFGLHVYIASRIAWTETSDVDLRFTAGLYPYHHLEHELLHPLL